MQRRDFLKCSAIAGIMPLLGSLEVQAQDNQGWIDIPGTNGKLKIKTLLKIGTAQCLMYKLAPNFTVGPHKHPAGEYSYVVEGSFDSGSYVLMKGDYVYREPGTLDPEGRSGDEGAVVMVFTPEPIIKI